MALHRFLGPLLQSTNSTSVLPEGGLSRCAEVFLGKNFVLMIAESTLELASVQDPSEQRPHKLSYHLTAKGDDAQKVISQLGEALKAAGVRAKIIYSGGMDVDILPEGASKGDGPQVSAQTRYMQAKHASDADLNHGLRDEQGGRTCCLPQHTTLLIDGTTMREHGCRSSLVARKSDT